VYFAQQQVVFVQPSSNLFGSWFQQLFGLAGDHNRTGPAHALSYCL
jgi:hypothetical protein